MSSPSANLYFLRIFQPGYGPKIVCCLLSDLGEIDDAQDLRGQNIYWNDAGPPSDVTLPNGNYSDSIDGTGYLLGDLYLDNEANDLYSCTSGGSGSTSTWTQISGGGGGADNLFTITSIADNYVSATGPGGGSFTIYKPLEVQGGLTDEVIDSETITYTDYTDNFNERTATDSALDTGQEYLSPRYAVGQIISARTANGRSGLSFPSGTGLPTSGTFLLEYSPARQWGVTD